MQISEIKNDIDRLWEETEQFWKDDYSKKYKSMFISEIDLYLDNMSSESNRLICSSQNVLKILDDIQES